MRIIVVGPACSGKTTRANHIFKHLPSGAPFIDDDPVEIRKRADELIRAEKWVICTQDLEAVPQSVQDRASGIIDMDAEPWRVAKHES